MDGIDLQLSGTEWRVSTIGSSELDFSVRFGAGMLFLAWIPADNVRVVQEKKKLNGATYRNL